MSYCNNKEYEARRYSYPSPWLEEIQRVAAERDDAQRLLRQMLGWSGLNTLWRTRIEAVLSTARARSAGWKVTVGVRDETTHSR